jgi:hypothetical protein
MPPAEPAQAAHAASLLTHLKNNRIEYIGLLIIAHLLGVPMKALELVGGVC